MMILTLIYIINIFIFTNNAQISPLGSEQSFRRSLEMITKGKLDFSSRSLPYDRQELSDTTPRNHSEYDFIVIGAGTAGSTIAARLSEMEDVTVLLIEAGGTEYSIIDVPDVAIPLQLNDAINWNYQTEKSDNYCRGLKDQKCKWPTGKVMGGSSTIDYMVSARGNRADYDEWAEVTGDRSWSFSNMLRYLKKMENFHEKKGIPVDIGYHGKNGPLPVHGPKRKAKLTEAFIHAGEEMHYTEVDYNGHKQLGFSHYQNEITQGERWSNNRAYLRPAKGRKNLILTQNSYVHKVLIDKYTKSACGVRYSKNDCVYEVKARKEVILCAGPVNSPQILMLSGVGPSKHLCDLNIEVIKDAPVGENLIDHVGYPGIAFKTNVTSDSNESDSDDSSDPDKSDSNNSSNSDDSYNSDEKDSSDSSDSDEKDSSDSSGSDEKDSSDSSDSDEKDSSDSSDSDESESDGSSDSNESDLDDSSIRNYFENRTGPLALGWSLGGIAYVNVEDQTDPRPDIELLFNLNSGLKEPSFAAAFGLNDEYQKKLSAEKPRGSSWTMWPVVMKPHSRGKILLRSNNPLDKPKIIPNYLEDPRDLKTLIKGIRFVIKLSKTKAFQRHASQMYDIPLPCDYCKRDSDEYWECAIRTFTATLYHPVGTCRMGRNDDDRSVVDTKLNVIGVKGLRVVDASVMPDITRGPTANAVTAIAERAAEIIKRDCISLKKY